MTANGRRKIESKLQHIYISDLQGSVDDAIKYFKNLKANYEEQYTLEIKIESGYDEDQDELYLCGTREETQQEYEQRIEFETQQKEREIERCKQDITYAKTRLKELTTKPKRKK